MSASGLEEIQGLAARAQSGDRAAYQLFLKLIADRYRPKFRRLLPQDIVDDAIQELLMSVHKSLHTYDSSKSIGPWLNAIAHYKAQDQLRLLYKSMSLVELDEKDLESSPENPLSKLEVLRLLAKLSEKEQRVVKMLKLEELSVEEVSQSLGMSVSNVKVTSFRAMGKLRNVLVEEEFYERK